MVVTAASSSAGATKIPKSTKWHGLTSRIRGIKRSASGKGMRGARGSNERDKMTRTEEMSFVDATGSTIGNGASCTSAMSTGTRSGIGSGTSMKNPSSIQRGVSANIGRTSGGSSGQHMSAVAMPENGSGRSMKARIQTEIEKPRAGQHPNTEDVRPKEEQPRRPLRPHLPPKTSHQTGNKDQQRVPLEEQPLPRVSCESTGLPSLKTTSESTLDHGASTEATPSSTLFDLINDMKWTYVIARCRRLDHVDIMYQHPETGQTCLYLALSKPNPTVHVVRALLQAAQHHGQLRWLSTTPATNKNQSDGSLIVAPLHVACQSPTTASVLKLLVEGDPAAVIFGSTSRSSTAFQTLWDNRTTTESNYSHENYATTFWRKMDVLLQAACRAYYGDQEGANAGTSDKGADARKEDDEYNQYMLHMVVYLVSNRLCPRPVFDYVVHHYYVHNDSAHALSSQVDSFGRLPLHMAIQPVHPTPGHVCNQLTAQAASLSGGIKRGTAAPRHSQAAEQVVSSTRPATGRVGGPSRRLSGDAAGAGPVASRRMSAGGIAPTYGTASRRMSAGGNTTGVASRRMSAGGNAPTPGVRSRRMSASGAVTAPPLVVSPTASSPADHASIREQRSIIATLLSFYPQAVRVVDPLDAFQYECGIAQAVPQRHRLPLHAALINKVGLRNGATTNSTKIVRRRSSMGTGASSEEAASLDAMTQCSNGIRELIQAAPELLLEADPITSLYPFQLAALRPDGASGFDCDNNTIERECIETVFHLLRLQPSVMSEYTSTARVAAHDRPPVASMSETASDWHSRGGQNVPVAITELDESSFGDSSDASQCPSAEAEVSDQSAGTCFMSACSSQGMSPGATSDMIGASLAAVEHPLFVESSEEPECGIVDSRQNPMMNSGLYAPTEWAATDDQLPVTSTIEIACDWGRQNEQNRGMDGTGLDDSSFGESYGSSQFPSGSEAEASNQSAGLCCNSSYSVKRIQPDTTSDASIFLPAVENPSLVESSEEKQRDWTTFSEPSPMIKDLGPEGLNTEKPGDLVLDLSTDENEDYDLSSDDEMKSSDKYDFPLSDGDNEDYDLSAEVVTDDEEMKLSDDHDLTAEAETDDQLKPNDAYDVSVEVVAVDQAKPNEVPEGTSSYGSQSMSPVPSSEVSGSALITESVIAASSHGKQVGKDIPPGLFHKDKAAHAQSPCASEGAIRPAVVPCRSSHCIGTKDPAPNTEKDDSDGVSLSSWSTAVMARPNRSVPSEVTIYDSPRSSRQRNVDSFSGGLACGDEVKVKIEDIYADWHASDPGFWDNAAELPLSPTRKSFSTRNQAFPKPKRVERPRKREPAPIIDWHASDPGCLNLVVELPILQTNKDSFRASKKGRVERPPRREPDPGSSPKSKSLTPRDHGHAPNAKQPARCEAASQRVGSRHVSNAIKNCDNTSEFSKGNKRTVTTSQRVERPPQSKTTSLPVSRRGASDLNHCDSAAELIPPPQGKSTITPNNRSLPKPKRAAGPCQSGSTTVQVSQRKDDEPVNANYSDECLLRLAQPGDSALHAPCTAPSSSQTFWEGIKSFAFKGIFASQHRQKRPTP
jgi:hypothetical protein